jgi:hypothetical protein
VKAPTQQKRHRGRFDSGFTPRELWQITREVAEHVAAALGIDPKTVSLRAFDSGRAPAGRPDAPTARAICGRLKVSWPVHLERVFSNARKPTMSLAADSRSQPADHLNDDYVYYSLRRVAADAETISELSYQSKRDQLVDEDKKRNGRRSTAEIVLPSRNQIISYTGTWDRALEIAGLQRPPQGKTATAMTVIDALDLYIETTSALYPETNGYVASPNELRDFGRRSGLSFANPKVGRAWPTYLAELEQSRASRGLATPRSYAPREGRQAIVAQGNAATAAARRDYWTPELCIEALRGWDARLAAGAKRTQRAYQMDSAGDPDLPGLRQIQQHCGTFAAARDEAMRRNREG